MDLKIEKKHKNNWKKKINIFKNNNNKKSNTDINNFYKIYLCMTFLNYRIITNIKTYITSESF